MRVSKVETFVIGGSWRNWVVVRLLTDDGLEGVGEAYLEGKADSVRAAVGELARYITGKDPFQIERHFQEMYRRAFYAGGEVLNSAISGVETAMWDLKGKALGVPVYEMLGGRTRDRVKLYANGWYRQGMEPVEFAAAARDTIALGFKGLKFNPWGGRQGIDFYRIENSIFNAGVESVAAIREAVGPDVDLFIDCNGIFQTSGNAVRAANAVEEFNIGFFEEPVPHENLDAMAYVRSKINIPVATGERLFTPFAFTQLLERGGADIVQPDMSHCGGMLSALKISAIADSHYAAFTPHNPNGEISHAAAVQMADIFKADNIPPQCDMSGCTMSAPPRSSNWVNANGVNNLSPVATGMFILLRTYAIASRFSCGTGSSKNPMLNSSTALAARTAFPEV
jgi:galactonate dehydratase